jgi:radical SAM protein with 4Fe4S-binding SPASM domain
MKNKIVGKELIQKFKDKGLSEDFCIVPFTTLQLEADGNVNMCRQKGTEFSIGNIKDKTIEEIWNDKPIREIRKEFLDGNIKTCEKDIRYKKCNLCTENNEIFDEVEIAEVQTGPILRLGFNINGKCNLQCQMCHVWKMPNDLYTNENFWNYAKERIFPTLREVELLSGEPFLQKDTYKLIDILSKQNPTCRWIITTNGHWKLNNKIKKDLDKVLLRDIIISIDSVVPETYSKIRKLGNLEVVLKNLEDFINYEKNRRDRGLSGFNIKINYLIQKDNWKEIKIIHDFNKNKPEISSFITFLHEPHVYSLLTLTENQKLDILHFYFTTLNPQEIALTMRVLRPIIMSLNKKNKVKYMLKLRDNIAA